MRHYLVAREFEKAGIGLRIARARHEAGGMTQQELADVLGVTVRSVQNYEAGVTTPWRHMQQIIDATGKSLRWFVTGEDDMPSDQLMVLEQRVADLERRLG